MSSKERPDVELCRTCRWSQTDNNGMRWCEYWETYVTPNFHCDNIITDRKSTLMKREDK